MNTGALLTGLAVTLFVVAYLARPFRRAYAGVALDLILEEWIAEVRYLDEPYADSEFHSEHADADDEGAGFCTKCGRRSEPDDIFCAKCGAKLREV